MAPIYGRTVDRWATFFIDNSAAALQQIPIISLAGAGIDYPVVDLTATQDPGHGGLPDTPNFKMTVTSPFDTTATTGAFTVITGVVGKSVPLAFDYRQGIQHTWEAGEPNFGVTGTTANGVLVTNLMVNPEAGTFSFDLILFPGSALPDWAIAAHT